VQSYLFRKRIFVKSECPPTIHITLQTLSLNKKAAMFFVGTECDTG